MIGSPAKGAFRGSSGCPNNRHAALASLAPSHSASGSLHASRAAGHIAKTRGNSSQQHMLVKRHFIFPPGIPCVAGTEPMRKKRIDGGHILSAFSARHRSTCAARIVHQNAMDTRILRSTPQRCFRPAGSARPEKFLASIPAWAHKTSAARLAANAQTPNVPNLSGFRAVSSPANSLASAAGNSLRSSGCTSPA